MKDFVDAHLRCWWFGVSLWLGAAVAVALAFCSGKVGARGGSGLVRQQRSGLVWSGLACFNSSHIPACVMCSSILGGGEMIYFVYGRVPLASDLALLVHFCKSAHGYIL